MQNIPFFVPILILEKDSTTAVMDVVVAPWAELFK
jgi:hypothetical protein